MHVGFVGLGKLGYPCALATSSKGHEVIGYDIDARTMNDGPRPYRETAEDGSSSLSTLLHRSELRFGTLAEVVAQSQIIFVAVQTPHEEQYEGTMRLPDDRADFNYYYLVTAIRSIAELATKDTIVCIISTVLPGTIRRLVLPVISDKIKLCYNPFFIAMGSTMRDFLHPEFVLLGVHDVVAAETVAAFYRSLVDAPVFRTSIENAELIKVAYNTFIGMKIAFANTIMEICHKLPGTDVDTVMAGLKMSHRRLISPMYLDGGMGDGGACHPRDNIALSWLARELGLSYDWFEHVMLARERQTEWLADLMCAIDLPKGILGYAFKAESDICTGSPALLLEALLVERGASVFKYDPVVEGRTRDLSRMPPHVFVVGTRHATFRHLVLPPGSVVIDPWRYVSANSGVRVVRVGEGPQQPDLAWSAAV